MTRPLTKKLTALLALTLTAALPTTQARSLSDIQKSEILVVGLSNNVPPFQFKAGDVSVGFEVEIIRAIASDLGVNVKFRDIPSIPKLSKALQDGEVDAIISTLAITSTREKGGDFTRPYACLGASIFTNDPAVNTVNDLKGRTVGMVKDTAFLNYLQKQPFEKRITEYPTAELMMQAFVEKKHEGTIAWNAMIPYINKVYRLNLRDTPVLWSIPVGMMVNENNTTLRLAINNSILKMQRDGRFNKLDEKYFPLNSVKCGRQ